MPYKRKEDEILVDPVAAIGEVPEASPYLQPGPAPVEAAAPVRPQFSAEHEAELNRRVAANILAAFAPPAPEKNWEQEEIDRLAASVPAPSPEVSTLLPTVVTPDGIDDCTSCGHPNPASQKFCGECGARVEKIPKWGCGHDNIDTAKFCGECGAKAFTRPGWSLTQSAADDHAVMTAPAQSRPKPESQLTPAEKAERLRRHNEAIRLGSQDVVLAPEAPQTSQTILIHFLEDGITFAGQVWFRGQEIELDKTNPRYSDPETGAWRWIHTPEFDQVQRWGKVMFREGPWPGKRFSDISATQFQALAVLGDKSGTKVQGPSQEELARAEQAEAIRRRGVQPMRIPGG